MNEQDKIDLWKDDAQRLARLLTGVVPVLNALVRGGETGVAAQDPKGMQGFVNEINQVIGAHVTLVNVLKDEAQP